MACDGEVIHIKLLYALYSILHHALHTTGTQPFTTAYPGFPLSWLQKVPGLFQEFPGPRSIFPEPCRKPAMSKYSKKQQLMSLGERCKLSQRGPGRNPGRESIFGIPAAQKTYLMDTIMAIFVCINMSIWNQKLPCSSLPSKFQDFPGSCKYISRTILDQGHFSGLSRSWKLTTKNSRTFPE